MKKIGGNSGFVESELVAVSHEQDSYPQIVLIHFSLGPSRLRTINIKNW